MKKVSSRPIIQKLRKSFIQKIKNHCQGKVAARDFSCFVLPANCLLNQEYQKKGRGAMYSVIKGNSL